VQVDVAATPGVEHELLPPGLRRHLYLFAKEALTNAARHARAQHVRLDLALRSRELELTIQDDGAGFDPGAANSGHGLSGLRRRALTLQGALAVDTAPGRGTRIHLIAPRPGAGRDLHGPLHGPLHGHGVVRPPRGP
jgi:signal transduction histidine kinase